MFYYSDALYTAGEVTSQ